MSTSSRVIKNTGYLYIKMGISIFISLYSTRLVLSSLGASDFGTYNVVGGAIAMLGFLNSTLANATQRFMSYAEGEGQLENKTKIFNVSVVLHVFIAMATVLLLLLAMPPLFNSVFNIDPERVASAKIVFCCLIVSTVLTIINVPYDAVMNAHENMLYYSVIGIFESLLKLGVAFICVKTARDKLVVYGILMACIPLITLSIMKVYCHRHYEECVIAPRQNWDVGLVKKIATFSGWNFLTAISSLFTAQGIGVVLNHFYGSVLNAAQGIAQQVNGYMSSFSSNMMKALNPVIVKNAGANNIASMNRATLAGCKFSAMLTLLFAVPLSLEIRFVLDIWLKEVPEWAKLFCVMQLVQSIIVQMASSAATAVYAQGDIKNYAIWKSIMNAMPVLLVWIAFSIGGSPIWLYIPMIVVWAVGGDIVIIQFAKRKCGLILKDYLMHVFAPLVITVFSMLICGSLSMLLMSESFVRFVITCLATTFGMFISAWFFAVTQDEKMLFLGFVRQLIKAK